MTPLSLIVAADRNGLIGADGGLPWRRLPADMERFRALTMGRACLVGRKTQDRLPHLPGRLLIVLSRRTSGGVPDVRFAPGFHRGLALAAALEMEPVVIGGAEVFAQALPYATRLYLTTVEAEFAGDVYFPARFLSPLEWTATSRRHVPADGRNPHALTFVDYVRTTP